MKAKRFAFGFFLSLCLALTGVFFVACGEDVPVRFIRVAGYENEVVVGTEFVYDDFYAEVKLQSGKEVIITAEDLEVGTVDTSTAGVKTITVKYVFSEDKVLQITVEINVVEDYVVGISSVSGLETTAVVHSNYNYTTGVSAVAVFKSGETRTVQSTDLTFTQISTDEAGEKTITVSYTYQNVTVTKNITVNVVADYPVEIDEATITGIPAEIEVGTDFAYDDIAFAVIYASANYTKTVNKNTEGFSIDATNINKDVVGNYNVVISYEEDGITVSKTVTVAVCNDIPVEIVSVTKASVLNGEDYTTGAVVNTKFHQNVQVNASDLSFNLTNLNKNVNGKYQVTVSYTLNGQTASKEITVTVYSEDKIESIYSYNGFITRIGLNETYTVPNDAYIKVEKTSEEKIDVVYGTAGLTVDYSAVNTNQTGIYQVSFTYTESRLDSNGDEQEDTVTGTLNVEVCDYVTEVSIASYSNKLGFGRTYNLENTTLTVTYQSGNVVTLHQDDLDATVTNNQLGAQTLTISTKTNYLFGSQLTSQKLSDTAELTVYDYVTDYAITGQYANSVEIGSDYDKTGITLTLYLASGATIVIPNDNLEITIDNSEYDLQDNLAVYYTIDKDYILGQEEDLDIVVRTTVVVNEKNESGLEFLAFDEPSFVTIYKTNSQKQNAYTQTGSDGAKGFSVLGNKYVVGDDNDFIFSPILTVDNGTTSIELENYNAVFKVYLYNTSTTSYDLLTGDDLNEYVKINPYFHSLDFTDEAVGEAFKIVVLPKMNQDSTYEIEFEFDVIDGYNVYNAADLSVMDNVNFNDVWTELKTQNNIPINLDVNAMILHRNISIEHTDIPNSFFWQASELNPSAPDYNRVLGSLKDSSGQDGRVYWHAIKDGGTFRFEGNYFTLSVENLPRIVRERNQSTSEEGKAITTHTSLFFFNGIEHGNLKIGTYQLNNISLFGNAKKTENVIASGGILCFKKKNTVLQANNLLSQCWFIAMFQDEGGRNMGYNQEDVYMEINDCNVFDSYNTLIYNWGGTLFINDSTFIGAGGPVMICDHVYDKLNQTKEDGTTSEVKVTNSKLESLVVGLEGWFQTYGATSLATSIKQLDNLFNAFGKTILDLSGQKMNLIAVYKHSGAEGLTATEIKGTFEVEGFNTKLDVDSQNIKNIMNSIIYGLAMQGLSQEEITTLLGQTAVVEAYNGAVCVPGTNGLLYPDIVDPEHPSEAYLNFAYTFAQATGYANLYLFNGMGAVFGLSNYTPPSN